MDKQEWLEQRGHRWCYVRRVPTQYRCIDTRRRVKVALLTDSLTIARERRDALMDADEHFWESSLAKHMGTTVEETPEMCRYRSARRRARAMGFEFKPMAKIAAFEPVENIVRRVQVLAKPDVTEREAEATLGTIEPPKDTVRDAFKLYCDKLSIGETSTKSPEQIVRWKSTKARAVASAVVERDVATVLGGLEDGAQFTFAKNTLGVAEARYWRVLVNAISNPSERTALGELELRSGDAPLNAFSTATVSVPSSFRSSYIADNLVDGDLGTPWAPAPTGGAGDWVAFDLGEGKSASVASLTLSSWANTTFAPQQAPVDFDLQRSDDGQAWTTVQNFQTPPTWRASESRSFSVDGFGVEAVSLHAKDGADVAGPNALAVACEAFGLGPKSLRTQSPVGFRFANRDRLAVGTLVDVWRYRGGVSMRAGEGRVVSAQTIEATLNGVDGESFYAMSPKAAELAASENAEAGIVRPSTLADGNVSATVQLPSVSTIFGDGGTSLVYNSLHAAPRGLIEATLTLPADRGLPEGVRVEARVGGLVVGTRDLSLDDPAPLDGTTRETLALAFDFDASRFASGTYPVRLTVVSRYACSQVRDELVTDVVIVNREESPFGEGWSMPGLDRIALSDEGVATLIKGTGEALQFERTVNVTDLPPGDGLRMEMFDAPNPVLAVATDFEGLEAGEFTVTLGGGEPRPVRDYIIPFINFPDTSFDVAAFYNVGLDDAIEPGSSATQPLGDDFSFQPPGGNETFGARFTGFLYLEEGGDVEFELVVDDTFDLRLEGRTLIDFISETDSRKFTATLPDVSPGFVPIQINFGENRVEADLVVRANGAGLPGGLLTSANLFSELPELIGFKYASPDGDFSELARNEDGTWRRRLKNGVVQNFDAEGRLVAVSDRNGNTRAYVYDDSGRVTLITDPGGLETRLSYGTGGRLSAISDPADRTANFTYATDGTLSRVRNTDDSVQTFRYNAQGRLLSRTDEGGFETAFAYANTGRLTGVVAPDSTSIALLAARSVGLAALDASNDTPVSYTRPEARETESVDGRGNVSLSRYDVSDRLIYTRDAIGRETFIARNADGLVARVDAPSSVTTSGRLVTEMEYDERGNLVRLREAVGTDLERESRYAYEPVFSQLLNEVDADGFETAYAYDDAGNLVEMRDALGATSSMSYDARGLRTGETDKNTNATSMEYDEVGRLIRMIDSSGDVTEHLYDAAGNLLAKREGVGSDVQRLSSYLYDPKGRVSAEIAGDGGRTEYSYDTRGNLLTTVDPTGIIETRTYDDRDRLASIHDPATGLTSFAYDADSNLLRTTDALGETTEFAYDAVNRLESSVDALGQLRAFAYDVRDNIVAVTDARANVTRMGYDALDRAVLRANPVGDTWTFGYDRRDNRVRSTKPDGVVIASTYDGLSRLVGLEAGTGVGAVERCP